ncbi:hypothetical protein ABTD98_21250, partial [Acinetobacter baumannii]
GSGQRLQRVAATLDVQQDLEPIRRVHDRDSGNRDRVSLDSVPDREFDIGTISARYDFDALQSPILESIDVCSGNDMHLSILGRCF